jgi:hypothetical protein
MVRRGERVAIAPHYPLPPRAVLPCSSGRDKIDALYVALFAGQTLRMNYEKHPHFRHYF